MDNITLYIYIKAVQLSEYKEGVLNT